MQNYSVNLIPSSMSHSNMVVNSTQTFTENQVTQEGTSTVYEKKEEEISRFTVNNEFSGQVLCDEIDLWNETVTIENVSIK